MKKSNIFFYLLLLIITKSSFGLELDIKTLSPTSNYFGLFYKWGSNWGGSLDILLSNKLFLDKTSSQPKGYLSRVYDGNIGNLNDTTGSFLIFDNHLAAFRLKVPNWRSVEDFRVYTLEKHNASKAKSKLFFETPEGNKHQIKMTREIVNVKNNVAHVKYYTSQMSVAKSNGHLIFKYNNPDFGSAFISEIVIDNLCEKECFFKNKKEILNNNKKYASTKDISNSKLLFWNQHKFGIKYDAILHSMIFRTEYSGDPLEDLTPVWIATPKIQSLKKAPLVILVSDYKVPELTLELLGFSGRPEFSIASDLVASGFSVLAFSSIPLKTKGMKETNFSQNELRLTKILDTILDNTFLRRFNINFDNNNVGIWGYGTASILALKVLSNYKQIKAATFSRLDINCCSEKIKNEIISQLNNSLGSRNIILFDKSEILDNLKKSIYNKNLKLLEAKFEILSQQEKEYFVNFMTNELIN